MIGWLRAAWDDSRRAAYTRRGSNPMSREEWFELRDQINSDVVDKINGLPTRETIRKAVDQIREDLRAGAQHGAYAPLTRSDIEAIAVNATGDLIGNVFLGSSSPDAPNTAARKVTGVIRTDDGDGVVREWDPETFRRTDTRPVDRTPAPDDAVQSADLRRRFEKLGEEYGEKLAAEYLEFVGIKRKSPDLATLAERDGLDAPDGKLDERDGNAPREQQEVAGPIFFVDRNDCRLPTCDGFQGLEQGLSDLDRDVVVGPVVPQAIAADLSHDASPSVGDAGAHSVGEGEVTGVETAAPVTDATDVFAGPGLFRYDGSQAHTAEPSQPTTTTTRQIAEVLEELHNQGNSWREIASKTRHIFTAPASAS